MSASDAAPLPRLGEVFFDVRGSSRSMRLSWYADTGVAVFSIWQGGMCTGTFRLPIDDLPRMVEILQRGPHGAAPAGGQPGYQHGNPSYGQDERFVPPYVREPAGEYLNDNDSTVASPRPRSRHAAYPADFAADRSDPRDYRSDQYWAETRDYQGPRVR
jgi:hypothetical protein